MWEKEEDLGYTRELVDKFEGRLDIEVRRQEGVKTRSNPGAEDFKRMELQGKYITKLLYGWNYRKFKKEYLRKLERNWQRWKSVYLKEKP